MRLVTTARPIELGDTLATLSNRQPKWGRDDCKLRTFVHMLLLVGRYPPPGVFLVVEDRADRVRDPTSAPPCLVRALGDGTPASFRATVIPAND